MTPATGAPPQVLVAPDAQSLAAAVAARLITRLVDVQSVQPSAGVVLTGGGIGTAVLESVRDSPARDAVDWTRVDLWWGDERFLPAGDPERNETGARTALLDALVMPRDRVHPMPASDGPDGDDPQAAAQRYARMLAGLDGGAIERRTFDIVLLGVGPDAHVASLFPGMPALDEQQQVVAVRDAPKPPPTRLSLTLPALGAAREAWLLAAGDSKADAVALALSGVGPSEAPAAGVRGRERTLWLLDRAAAAKLPAPT